MAFWDDFRKGFGVVWNPIIDAVPNMIRAAAPVVGGAIGTAVAPGAGTAVGSAIGSAAGAGLGKLAEDIPHFANGGYVGGMPMQGYYPQVPSYSYANGGQVGAGFQNQVQQAPQQQYQQPQYKYGQPSMGMNQQMGNQYSPQQNLGQYGSNVSAPARFANGGSAYSGIGLQDAINMLPTGGYR